MGPRTLFIATLAGLWVFGIQGCSSDSDDDDDTPTDDDDSASSDDDDDTADSCPACVADFAVYDPAYEDDGVWEDEVTALGALFDAYGWTYESLAPQDIEGGALGTGKGQRYRVLVAPGGSAYNRDLDISEHGEDLIRAFLDGGGGYIGFCAGTSWTADSIIWAEEATGGGGTFNQASDYATYQYDLRVFDGSIQAPFGWQPWEYGRKVSFEVAQMDLGNPTLAAAGVPAETRFFYYGGPVYQPFGALPDYEVWATAVAPAGLPPAARTGEGEPTIIRFSYGSGSVVLFSYHPVILVDSLVDGVELTGWVDESAVEWDTGAQTLPEINLQSWNILHTAFQVLLGEEVTPITQLP